MLDTFVFYWRQLTLSLPTISKEVDWDTESADYLIAAGFQSIEFLFDRSKITAPLASEATVLCCKHYHTWLVITLFSLLHWHQSMIKTPRKSVQIYFLANFSEINALIFSNFLALLLVLSPRNVLQRGICCENVCHTRAWSRLNGSRHRHMFFSVP